MDNQPTTEDVCGAPAPADIYQPLWAHQATCDGPAGHGGGWHSTSQSDTIGARVYRWRVAR